MVAVVAMVFFVVSVIHVASHGKVVVIMSGIMVVMVVGMHAHCHILAQVPMQARCRRPGELERNDEHDDQGDKATHGGYSTELIVSGKGG